MTRPTAALVSELLAWSRVWSTLVPLEERKEAWNHLGLPQATSVDQPSFVSTFVAGSPQPPVPLLLHALLRIDGAATREAWLRAAAYLGLKAAKGHLPPDHLGPACEILSVALSDGEAVLVMELCRRYLIKWCTTATELVSGQQSNEEVLLRFSETIDAVAAAAANDGRP